MLRPRLASVLPLSAWLVACGGVQGPGPEGSASVDLKGSVGSDTASVDAEASLAATAQGGAAPGAAGGAAQGGASARTAGAGGGPSSAGAAPLPPYDKELVAELLAKTAASPDGRERLGLRLAVLEQGPNARWLITVANRGTEPLRVGFDLRTLALEVQGPTPEPTPRNPRPKAPKPVVCALPKDVVPSEVDPKLELVIAPGEAVVDAFDPRLYCFPEQTGALLVPGATLTPRLGFPEKTKSIWKNGKREQRLLEQSAPFIAELASRKEPERVQETKLDRLQAEDGPREFEKFAVKQLVGPSFTLGEAYQEKPSEPDSTPLALELTRGSDAATEREATISVSLVNRSTRPETVFFRRELLRFELSGPTGHIECDPKPNNRAPDRAAFSRLAPGKSLSATSRLIELCPTGALSAPGLYLVFGRYESSVGGEEFGLAAFQGRVVSREPALVRIRKGWSDLPAQHEPLRVRIESP